MRRNRFPLATVGRFASRALLCILASFVLLTPAAVHAQLADLPLKPGLWDTQVSVNQFEPVVSQSCFTAGTTLGDYITASNKGSGAQCSVTNKTRTPRGFIFDTECKSSYGSSKSHIEFQSPDPEHFSGTTTTTLNMANAPKTIHKTFTAKFARSDCGSVKPMVMPGSAGK